MDWREVEVVGLKGVVLIVLGSGEGGERFFDGFCQSDLGRKLVEGRHEDESHKAGDFSYQNTFEIIFLHVSFIIYIQSDGKMKGPKPLTIVIKLGEFFCSGKKCVTNSEITGTSSIVDEKTHEPLLSILSLIVETAVKLHKDGHKVIIVSSGAIGVGLRRMDLDKRPKHLPRIQVRFSPKALFST